MDLPGRRDPGWASGIWLVGVERRGRVVSVLLRAGANPRGSAGIPAVECARRARQDEVNLQRLQSVLDRQRPTIADFDRVIALLESTERR
jgi:hypothetical protein